MMSPFDTSARVPVVQISGRFERTDMAVTDTGINSLLACGSRHVVLDLAGTSFVDLYGLATLIKIMKVCRLRGGDLHLTNVPATIGSIFAVTHLDRVFAMYPDTTTALAAAA